ncbi:hypothetical protein [Marinobacter sp.]|uniref:hypothetical protein n=1 Tax=Marinobacter sp. TaxID=50741 RepID=UPI003A92A6A6
MLPWQLQAAPEPINTEFQDDRILAELPAPAPEPLPERSSPERTADTLQTLITQARTSGDPRYLGYAQSLIGQWPDNELTERLLVLRATLRQSLHQFDAARADLGRVLSGAADRRQQTQARLTLANLELVQGRYAKARQHCQTLRSVYPGLIAESCQALVSARTGNAEQAYLALKRLVNKTTTAGPTNPTGRFWAEGTLGNIAAQTGLASAPLHWRNVLAENPDDLYIRAQLVDWHLEQGELETVLALTRGYDAVDTLAVIRAIAMNRMAHPDADALNQQLRQRFAEARWRGTMLHKRDFARFQLDVEQRTGVALEFAMENWQSQREPLDTRLALRAALAANNSDQLQKVVDWLTLNGQRDARYPEVR